ncbi:MAG: efflux RND transporter periplasmic adaptor subunit [Myxococcota bacterium]
MARRSLFFALFPVAACGSPPPADGPPVLPVRTEALKPQDHYEVERAFLGLVRPAQSTALGFERDGRVARVEVDEGETLEAGQLVATLDTARLQAERSRLRAQLRQLDAKVDLSERTSRRVNALADKKYASEQSRDEAALGLQADRAQRDEVQAALQQLEVELQKSVLKAPFAGTVVRRAVDPGAVVGPGQPVLELQGRSVAEAEIGLPVRRAGKMDRDRSYELRWRGETVHAPLSSVVDRVRPGARTVTALFALPADRRWVEAERIELLLRERIEADGYSIPLTALTRGPRGSWMVYVADGGIVVPEAVEILHADEERAFVRGTLQARQALVLDGTHRVVPGQRVDEVDAVAGVKEDVR